MLGDRWSLVILRDMIFGHRRTFRELLTQATEGIASNILAARLETLVAEGMATRSGDPEHRQKVIYSLTEKSIALVPVLVQLGAWVGASYRSARRWPSARGSWKRAARSCGPS